MKKLVAYFMIFLIAPLAHADFFTGGIMGTPAAGGGTIAWTGTNASDSCTEAVIDTDETSYTLTLPSNSTGDLLIAVLCADPAAVSMDVTTAGWTETNIDASGNPGVSFAWKTAGASDTTVAFSWSGANKHVAIGCALTGHTGSAGSASDTNGGAESTTPTSPDLTPSPDALAVVRYACQDGGGGDHAACAVGSDGGDCLLVSSTNGTSVATGIAIDFAPSSGAQGTANWGTTNQNDNWVGITHAFY